jgi:hypothetical protein
MSLFDRFLKTISSFGPSGISEAQTRVLSQLDTHKIYVENVRSLLGISHGEALKILETAVRQGVFERCVEVLCPDGTVAASASSEERLPRTVHCWVEDVEGHLDEADLFTESLKRNVFYRLDERSETVPHTRTA